MPKPLPDVPQTGCWLVTSFHAVVNPSSSTPEDVLATGQGVVPVSYHQFLLIDGDNVDVITDGAATVLPRSSLRP